MSFRTGVSAAALALALGVAGAAAQQQAPQPPKSETAKKPVTGQIMTQEEETILARDLIGHPVRAPDNSKIGNISDLLLSKDGKSVEGFVVGVGGFLGIGERSVALQMNQLQMRPAPDGSMQLFADLKKEDLANAPAFKSRKDIEAEKREAERRTQPTAPPGGGPQR